MEIWNAIFLCDAYLAEELRQVFCIIDDGVTWSLCSRNFLYQDIFVNQVLYVTYGCVLRADLVYEILFPEGVTPAKRPNGSLSNRLFRVYT